MAENEKPARGIPEIQQEYQSLCTKLGHLEYQMDAISKDANMVKSELRDLNLEAAAIQAKAPKPEEAAAPAVEEAKS